MKIYRGQKSKYKDQSLKRVAAYGLVALIIIFAFGVWGLTLLANLSNIWDTLRGSNAPKPIQDTVGSLTPQLYSLPSKTNQTKIDISGSAQSGSVVNLYKSGKLVTSQIVGNDGQFKFLKVALKDGLNVFTARAKLGASDESLDSNSVQVTLDRSVPKVTVSQPVDGSSVSSPILTVNGQTEPKATVTVNDQQEIVQDDGSFSGVVTLQAGANTITVVSSDEAGNKSTLTLSVTYSP